MGKKDKKKPKKPQHGGIRPGSGRPIKYANPVVKKSVSIPESLYEWAVAQGKPFSQVVVEGLECLRSR
jgi:hypothetical protein